MAPGAWSVRRAIPDDVPALDAITLANEGGPSGSPAAAPAVLQAYLRHLVTRGTVVVAERGGDVLGFGATVRTERSTHLADLFVLPALHGQGIGRELLAEAFGDAWPRTTFSSDDPRAMPLYVRAGMRPLWPNLYVSGNALRLGNSSGLGVEPTTFARMAVLERTWLGVDREPELPHWSAEPAARPFVVTSSGEPIATGFWRDRRNGVGRWIDHAVVRAGADARDALLAAMSAGATAGEHRGACIPGPSPVVQPLLEAGFRILDRDTFMASEPMLVDPEREIVNTGLL